VFEYAGGIVNHRSVLARRAERCVLLLLKVCPKQVEAL
jgi:hypothetical protein